MRRRGIVKTNLLNLFQLHIFSPLKNIGISNSQNVSIKFNFWIEFLVDSQKIFLEEFETYFVTLSSIKSTNEI